jgi:cysteine desulfurase/selenocysteine lyase
LTLSLETAPLRADFPGTHDKAYLNSAGLGLTSTAATAAVEDVLRLLEADPEAVNRGPILEETRAACARLVNADADEIALTPSTSLGLQLAADAIPLDERSNVVVGSSDFMSVISPWLDTCRDASAELRVVPHRQGCICTDDVVGRIDDHTRAVCLSSVQWTSGFRVDVAALGEECGARGIPLVVDGAQHIGVLTLDVAEMGISYLTTGGHKWLTSPSAMGFTFVSREFSRQFRPRLVYAPTSIPPATTWLEAWTDPDFDPVRDYEAPATAQRFEVGVHHAVLGAAALKASVELLLAAGPEVIEEHVLELGRRIGTGLRTRERTLVSSEDPEWASAITVFRADVSREDDVALTEFLRSRRVVVSTRYTAGVGGVRVSPHAYNNLSDVDTMFEGVDAWCAQRKEMGNA